MSTAGPVDPGGAAASLASIDGEVMLADEAVIPVTDEGLLRGDGVFEVIRVYDGTPFKFEDHMARLERSAANLRLPIDLEAIRADAFRLLARTAGERGHDALRVVCTRGGRRILLTEPLHALPERVRLASVTYSPTRVLDGVKSLSYAANMLARRVAQEQGADDALLVTPHGRVLEAPTASVFWASDGRLMTPPLSDHILASITRGIVLEVTAAEECECSLDELLEADELFLASSLREVHPVCGLDGREFEEVGPLTRQAVEAVAGHIAEQIRAA